MVLWCEMIKCSVVWKTDNWCQSCDTVFLACDTVFLACPAAVTVEGSRDRSQASMVPLCAPVSTGGLTTIKIHLLRHEIVSVVTIRLHKPRDSQTIGLSQIMLMGYMAFGDLTGAVPSRIANIFTPMEDYVSRTGYVPVLAVCWILCVNVGSDFIKLT